MPLIRIMHARIPDKLPTVWKVADRLETFLRNLRRDEANNVVDPDGLPDLTVEEKARISARAEAYVEFVKRSTKASHLKSEDISAIRPLRDGAKLIEIDSEARADEIGAALEEEMPWMNAANERIWLSLRRSVKRGDPGIRIPPMMLVGPPGIGKSFWARRLGELLTIPTTIIEATGEPASFAVVGSQRGWGSAGPGRLMQTLIETRVANPILVIDEIEKAGNVFSQNQQSYGLANALLPLLERSTAARWTCPFYRIAFDVSWVGWVLTANGTKGVPEPLLSRCPPMLLPDLTTRHLAGFAERETARRGLPDDISEVIMDVLGRTDGRAASLRTVVRMIEAAEAVMERPMLH